jgi:hypothetical protein
MNHAILRSAVALAASILPVVPPSAAVPTKGVAQTSAATQTPGSAEVSRLEEEKAQAELREAIALQMTATEAVT